MVDLDPIVEVLQKSSSIKGVRHLISVMKTYYLEQSRFSENIALIN